MLRQSRFPLGVVLVVYLKRCEAAKAVEWSSGEARDEPPQRNGMAFATMRKRGMERDEGERTAGRV